MVSKAASEIARSERVRLLPDFGLNEFGHDLAPSPLDKADIASRQVRFGDLQVQSRLLMGLVLRMEESLGNGPVTRFETGLLFRNAILDEEYSVVSLKQTEAQFHNYPHGY